MAGGKERVRGPEGAGEEKDKGGDRWAAEAASHLEPLRPVGLRSRHGERLHGHRRGKVGHGALVHDAAGALADDDVLVQHALYPGPLLLGHHAHAVLALPGAQQAPLLAHQQLADLEGGGRRGKGRATGEKLREGGISTLTSFTSTV